MNVKPTYSLYSEQIIESSVTDGYIELVVVEMNAHITLQVGLGYVV